jgi:hypothetical protein
MAQIQTLGWNGRTKRDDRKRSFIQEAAMSHRESSNSRPEIRPCKTVPRGRLLEAFMLDHVEPSCRQRKGQSLSALVGCPNICPVLSSQHAQGEQRRSCAPATILGEHGLLYEDCLKMRHRRLPVEREVADPQPAKAPEEEATSEEEDTRVKEGLRR